jgi:hypothetical protein
MSAWGERAVSDEVSVLLSVWHWVLEWPSESRSVWG